MRYMWKFFLLLMLVVTSCSEKQIDGNVINVAEAMSRLSEGQSVQNLFSSISYIPLETNEQAIIGKYPECIIMDSAILVSSVHQNLKLFDRTNGKYIRDIGHVGADPEGYAKDSWGKVSFWADAVRRTVYLLGWNNDFLLYGFDGKYKDRIRLQDTVNCILSQNYYLMDADRIWGHNKMKLSPETPSVFYMDRNTMSLTGIATWNSALLPMDEVLSVSNLLGGNVAYGGDLAMAEFVGDRKYYTAINSPSLWKSKDAIRVKQAFNDTIYTISEQGLTPYLVFELGEWHWSEQQQLDVEGCDKKIAIDYILENAEYIYFHFHTSLYLEESQSYCGFYHKEKKTVVCQKGDSLFDKMNNQHIQIRGVTSDGYARCGGNVEQICVRAGGGDTRRQSVFKHIGGTPGVLADHDAGGVLRVLPAVIPAQKTAHLEGVLRRQINAGLAPETVCTKIFTHQNNKLLCLLI